MLKEVEPSRKNVAVEPGSWKSQAYRYCKFIYIYFISIFVNMILFNVHIDVVHIDC